MNAPYFTQKNGFQRQLKGICNASLFGLILLMLMRPSVTYGNNEGMNSGEIPVVAYSDPNFKGRELPLVAGNHPRLDNIAPGFNWNDKISSIQVGKGYKVELWNTGGFQEGGHNGPFILFEGNYPNLWRWSDVTTSIRVIKVPDNSIIATFYCDPKTDFKAPKQCLSVGEYNFGSEDNLYADAFNYLDVPKGISVTVFDNWGDRKGRRKTFGEGTNYDLGLYGFKSNISAIEITRDSYFIKKLKIISKEEVPLPGKAISATAPCSTPGNAISPTECTNALTKEYSKSASIIWNSSETYTQNLTIGVEKEATFPLIGAAKLSVELSLSAAQTLGRGQENTTTETSTISSSQKMYCSPGYTVECTLIDEMKEVTYNVEYTYQSKKNESDIFTRTGKIKVDAAMDAKMFQEITSKPAFNAGIKKQDILCSGEIVTYVRNQFNEIYVLNRAGIWKK